MGWDVIIHSSKPELLALVLGGLMLAEWATLGDACVFLADGDLVRQRGGDFLVDHQLGTRTFLGHDASFRHRARLRRLPHRVCIGLWPLVACLCALYLPRVCPAPHVLKH